MRLGEGRRREGQTTQGDTAQANGAQLEQVAASNEQRAQRKQTAQAAARRKDARTQGRTEGRKKGSQPQPDSSATNNHAHGATRLQRR